MTRRLRAVVSVSAISLMPSAAHAKKVLGYVPPSYAYRLSVSFLVIMVMALVLGVASYIAMTAVDATTSRARRRPYVLCILAVVLIASLVAATDRYNDESWNPALWGSVFAALILPIAILVLDDRHGVPRKVISACCAALLGFIPIALLSAALQAYAFSRGIPTSW